MESLALAISSLCMNDEEAVGHLKWLLRKDKDKVIDLLNAMNNVDDFSVTMVLDQLHTFSYNHKMKETYKTEVISYITENKKHYLTDMVYYVVDPDSVKVDYTMHLEHTQKMQISCVMEFCVNSTMVTRVPASYSWINIKYTPEELLDFLLNEAKKKMRDRLSLPEEMVKEIVCNPDTDPNVLTRYMQYLFIFRQQLGHSQKSFATNVVEQIISKIKKSIPVGSGVPDALVQFFSDNIHSWYDMVYIDSDGLVIKFNHKTYIVISSTSNGYKRVTKSDPIFLRVEFALMLCR